MQYRFINKIIIGIILSIIILAINIEFWKKKRCWFFCESK